MSHRCGNAARVLWCWEKCFVGCSMLLVQMRCLLFQDVYIHVGLSIISDDVRNREGRDQPAEVARCDRGM